MKKLLAAFFIFIFLFQCSDLKSQKNNVKFMALSLLVVNYASISYEYEINNYNSVGTQIRGNLFYFPFSYIPPYYINYGFSINYRHYFRPDSTYTYFTQIETGYFYLNSVNGKSQYKSNNFILGPIVGFKKKFKKSKQWFLEASIGLVYINRKYTEYKYITEMPTESDPLDMTPYNENILRPRLNFEIGYRF